VLVAALACFSLPWLTVTADAKRADATGLELVTGSTPYTGYYVHDAWRGEVENVVDDGQLWAPIAFGALLVALVLLVLPWRAAWWSALAVSGIGVVLLLLFLQATTTTFNPPSSDHHYGYWLTLAIVPFVFVPIVVRLRQPLVDASLRRAPEWLTRSARPKT
jgi:hypothetical protein